MNKFIFIAFLVIVSVSCSDDDSDSPPARDYKQDMRDFVIALSTHAKTFDPDFFTIPQNGAELATTDGEEDGPADTPYLNAIDGHGQEDLFYGYVNDDQATPAEDNLYLRAFLDKSKSLGNTILVTDYCSTHSKMDDSYETNKTAGYISFAADERELNSIPSYPAPLFQENNAAVNTLSGIKNFLYLINPENYVSKTAFISAVTATNYDLIIMDFYFHDGTSFTNAEVDQLRNKANGGKRLVISYMSIGEAEDYRYYWQADWNANKPSWIDAENPDWPGNYKVKYWEQEWQAIIFGNKNAYLDKIVSAGFDGVYLDIIDAFEYYE